MDWKVFLTIFAAVFIAELGDKTQLATMLFAADKDTSRMVVFAAASAALIVATALGVLAGTLLSAYISEKLLAYVAGVGFILIGLFTFGLSLNFFVPVLSRAIADIESSVMLVLRAM